MLPADNLLRRLPAFIDPVVATELDADTFGITLKFDVQLSVETAQSKIIELMFAEDDEISG